MLNDIAARLRAIWNPALYHGHGITRGYFEGWYYKLVDVMANHRYAIIPGVFYSDDDPSRSHSFIQVLDGMKAESTYVSYPLEEFWASHRDFDIRVGSNRFQQDAISLDIKTGDLAVKGSLRFSNQVPWPVSPLSPGIMGYYTFIPFMQCYHGVLSLCHQINGALVVDGTEIGFDGGRGYMEKDWGRSFPPAWIWMQCNHFHHSDTSLTASVATIPWMGSQFTGFIIGLWHQGRLYKFATYTGAGIEVMEVKEDRVMFIVVGSCDTDQGKTKHRLAVEAVQSEAAMLLSPETSNMTERVAESMKAIVSVHLENEESDSPEVVFSGEGTCGCLEVVGSVDRSIMEETENRSP
jgi:hypothetical protein